MFTIICQTLTCLQMYLGSGYIISQTPDAILYSNFQKIYYCNRSREIYNCYSLPVDPIMGATMRLGSGYDNH